MDLVGKWSVSNESGLVDCMKNLGVPQAIMNLSNDIGLQLEVSKEGDTYTLKQTASLLLNEYTFKSGQQFTVKNFLGQPLQGTVAVQGNNKMVENVTEGGSSSVTTIQKVGSNLVRTREMGGTTCTLTYNKL